MSKTVAAGLALTMSGAAVLAGGSPASADPASVLAGAPMSGGGDIVTVLH